MTAQISSNLYRFSPLPMQEDQKKKRQESRLTVDILAQYKIEKSPNYVECLIVNISGVGLGVEIKSFLEEGDKMKLKFSLGDRDLEIDCIVMHILGKITGLQYQSMQGEDVEFIRDYVQSGFFERVKK